ncbi:MAG TPA: rRNA maturation RNase YbeY [Opitutaceae bacterium]|nr:rRNA maturation RNase YbeY [Opitutaceae bacterium]
MKREGRSIDVANRHPRLRIDRRALAEAVCALDANAGRFRGGCPPGGLSVAFLPDHALAGLHARYLGDPSATDVITFSGDAANMVAGEICVSVDAAERHARRTGARLSDEITLYVIHGWLHLAGYDDRKPADRRAMRRAEARAMRLLARSAKPRFKLA